jgi:plasmid stabilization system protein ParE
MVRKIIWRKGARADLVAIKDYIARESSLARAEKVVGAIELAADGLADFPYRFRKIPEFDDPDRRETFVYKYRVMYRIEPRCIRILRGARPAPSQERAGQLRGAGARGVQRSITAGPD